MGSTSPHPSRDARNRPLFQMKPAGGGLMGSPRVSFRGPAQAGSGRFLPVALLTGVNVSDCSALARRLVALALRR